MARTSIARRLSRLHRGAALVFGFALSVFGLLGFVNHLSWFDPNGPPILGLSTNLLLSTLSVVVGAVLIGAAGRGGRAASTTLVVVGGLFMLSGVVNSVLLSTAFNLLSFRMSNVVFSLLAGFVLIVLGAYGRFAGHLPADNPYRRARVGDPVDGQHSEDNNQRLPEDTGDITAARELADAERAVAAGGGNTGDRRRLSRVDAERDPARRRDVWRDQHD